MEGEPPPPKKSRSEPIVAADALRRRLDPDAPATLAVVLSKAFGFPPDLVAITLRAVDRATDPVRIVAGASFDPASANPNGKGRRVFRFESPYVVPARITIEEIVMIVRRDAIRTWCSLTGNLMDDLFAYAIFVHLSRENQERLTNVDLRPANAVSIASATPVPDEHRIANLRLCNSADGPEPGFAISGNLKLLTYAGSGLACPSVELM